ncbi:hypothetical protein, partial [Herbaspirillum chlorophenolicum]|uniref:hypothetical protein n=1 Tax=Herbaspirillum chlorophenolicum TaxID=211589 RepID=UPI001C3F4B98
PRNLALAGEPVMDGSLGSFEALGDDLDGMALHPELKFAVVAVTGIRISHEFLVFVSGFIGG